MRAEFQPPPEYPDHVDFDTQVIAWDFEAGGKPAKLMFIQPRFEEELLIAEGGEQITLTNPLPGTSLTITELDSNGEAKREHAHLTEADEQVYLPGNRRMRFTTTNSIVECVAVAVRKRVTETVDTEADQSAKPPPEEIQLPDLDPQAQARIGRLLSEGLSGNLGRSKLTGAAQGGSRRRKKSK